MAITQEGLEWAAEYSLQAPAVVGSYDMTGSSVGTYAAEASAPAGVNVFVVSATSDVGQSGNRLLVQGSLALGTSVTASATIQGLACIGYGYKVDFSSAAAGCSVAAISSITASGGQAGDTFDILAVPAQSQRTNLAFVRSLRSSEGVTFRNVPKDYNPADHQKRIRGENTISFEAPRESGQSGILSLRARRNYTLIFQKDTDGDGVVTESVIFEKVSGTINSINPLQEGGPVIDTYEGSYNRSISVLAQV